VFAGAEESTNSDEEEEEADDDDSALVEEEEEKESLIVKGNQLQGEKLLSLYLATSVSVPIPQALSRKYLMSQSRRHPQRQNWLGNLWIPSTKGAVR
jgi:hypothetical protein